MSVRDEFEKALNEHFKAPEKFRTDGRFETALWAAKWMAEKIGDIAESCTTKSISVYDVDQLAKQLDGER